MQLFSRHYLKNIQGDVEEIVDKNGNSVVKYAYNEWGKLLSVTGSMAAAVGRINPIRYRGYYYDGETGYYYLQSRYYNPDICRFINADEPSLITLGFCSVNNINLFSYCNNEPVNNIDPNGHWVARAVISGISGAVFGGIAYLIGRAFRISGWKLAAFTAVFVAAGITIGAIWGPNILYRINSLIKPVLYFFSNPGKVYFGVKFLSVIQFELHNPHHGKSIHLVIRNLKNGKWKQILEWVLKK